GCRRPQAWGHEQAGNSSPVQPRPGGQVGLPARRRPRLGQNVPRSPAVAGTGLVPADGADCRSGGRMRKWQGGEIIDGRYRVKQIHEDGGMGLVYRVHHLEWNTDLALKVPKPERFQTEEDRARFVAEAENWVGLGLHPHICACYYVQTLDAE